MKNVNQQNINLRAEINKIKNKFGVQEQHEAIWKSKFDELKKENSLISLQLNEARRYNGVQSRVNKNLKYLQYKQ